MNLPHFTAEASIYRSRRHYSAPLLYSGSSQADQTIVASYRPGVDTMKGCYECTEETCASNLKFCSLGADLGCLLLPAGCLAAQGTCDLEYLGCLGNCVRPGGDCCPTPCGVPNPFDPGSNCCDEGEHCVSPGDPNSRQGCCPSSQSVCGGRCCAPSEYCCGDVCCPEGTVCCGGTCCPNVCCGDECCDAGVPCGADGSCAGFGNHPPPPPPPFDCSNGGVPCGFPDSTGVIRTCCPAGQLCCGYSAQFGPDCKIGTCIH
jgi:hypothetical protein